MLAQSRGLVSGLGKTGGGCVLAEEGAGCPGEGPSPGASRHAIHKGPSAAGGAESAGAGRACGREGYALAARSPGWGGGAAGCGGAAGGAGEKARGPRGEGEAQEEAIILGSNRKAGGGALDGPRVCFDSLARGVEDAAPYGFCTTAPNPAKGCLLGSRLRGAPSERLRALGERPCGGIETL